jgi:hypothetical protein
MLFAMNRHLWVFALVILATVCAGCDDGKPAKVSVSQEAVAGRPKEPFPPTGIELSLTQPVLPDYVVTSGLSAAESWGRWSDSDRVVFRFGSDLPKRFALVISARAYGPNAGPTIPVKVGSQLREMKLSDDVTKEVRLEFSSSIATDSIEITVPKPTVPNNGDLRSLGIAFGSIKIDTLP